MVRKRMHALSMAEMEGIRRCVEQLVAALGSLKVSQAKESPAVSGIIESTIMTIGPIYDRRETVYEHIKAETSERQRLRREKKFQEAMHSVAHLLGKVPGGTE